MANDAIKLFNYYPRYRWRAVDFTALQDGLVDYTRGNAEGTFGAAVLKGFTVAPSGLGAAIGDGIAVGSTGYMHVIDEVNFVDIPSPTSDFARHLIVARPNIVQDEFITRPTNPFETVPLNYLLESQLVLIEGEESATPVYPFDEVEANDVIIAGVRMAQGATGVSANDFDFQVRDIPGKNSNFQQDAGRYDDRLRPYLTDAGLLGIKPSQLEPPFSRVFSYVNKASPSIFPKNLAGNYNPADTFLNFETGAITGGDETTTDFTPQIPSAGNAIVCTVGISSSDILSVTYGVQGTRDQCIDGIINQKTVGAGSVSVPTGVKLVAFVVVFSDDGSNVTELDFFDCRGTAAVGGDAEPYPSVSAGTQAALENAVTACLSAGGGVISLNASFSIDAPIVIPENTVLIGRKGSTVITILDGGQFFADQGAKFQDVYIETELDDIDLLILENNLCEIKGCQFTIPSDSIYSCVLITGSGNTLYKNTFIGVVGGTASGIEYASGGVDNADYDSAFLA